MVLQCRGTRRAPRLHKADRPRVARENLAGRDRPLAHGRFPVHVPRRKTDLAEHEIDHAVDDVALVAHVAVQRHRLDAELLGELAHAERLDAVLISALESDAQHSLAAQGPAAFHARLGSGSHCLHVSLLALTIRAYTVTVTPS